MGNIKRLWLPGLLSLLCACSGQKEPAQQAFAQVQASVDPVSNDLEKYAPEEYAKLSDLVNQMKTKLNAQDYDAVLTLRTQAMSQLMVASGATAKHKLELNKQLAGDWKTLAVAVPKMIADIAARIDVLQGAKQLPNGISAASVAQADAQLSSLNATWTSVLAMSKQGSTDAAIAKAQELKKRCVQIGSLLGLRLWE